jgi:hypothetical protein
MGVADDLVGEWAVSQPTLKRRGLHAGQQNHGWQWFYELAEVGKTFAAVGQPEGFGAAAGELFATSTTKISRPQADP